MGEEACSDGLAVCPAAEEEERKKNLSACRVEGSVVGPLLPGCARAAAALRCWYYASYLHWLCLIAVRK
jgi:hypothetical protein